MPTPLLCSTNVAPSVGALALPVTTNNPIPLFVAVTTASLKMVKVESAIPIPANPLPDTLSVLP